MSSCGMSMCACTPCAHAACGVAGMESHSVRLCDHDGDPRTCAGPAESTAEDTPLSEDIPLSTLARECGILMDALPSEHADALARAVPFFVRMCTRTSGPNALPAPLKSGCRVPVCYLAGVSFLDA